jgi:tetratricopeptide (TPR) repeat protein
MTRFYLKIIWFAIFMLSVSQLTAQRSNGLTVEGIVSVEEGRVEGAVIQMYRDGDRMDNYGIGTDGRYRVELNYNHEFTLIFTRDDNFPQKIVVDTHVPRNVLQSDPLFPPFPVNINLFTEIEGIDRTFSENTVLKIYYSEDVDNFISDVYYNNAQIKHLIEQAIIQSQMIDNESDYLAALTRAERAELQKEYDQLIEQAETEYNNEQFINALDGYKAASQIFPSEQYPKDRIAEINDLLGLLMVAGEMEKALAERLESLLKQGDLQFEREQFDEARSSYQRALSINAENEHAQARLAEIDDIFNQQNLSRQFNEFVKQGDNAFNELLYKEAQAAYQKALELKPDESYAQEKLGEVNAILNRQAQNAEKQKSYDEAIFQAELNFEKQFYEEAISFYEKALTFKPGDDIATAKIQEIKYLMYELANRTLYDRLIKSADRAFKREEYSDALADYRQAVDLFADEEWPNEQIAKIEEILETERNFARLISQADVAFENENYLNSRNLYQQALEVQPEDEHALERINEIDEILARQALDEQYAELISEADRLFNSEEFQQAKEQYQLALNVKPGEDYPEEKISEIDAIFEERERIETEYNEIIAQADERFEAEDFPEAKNAYQNALNIKDSEPYPLEMINRIDSIVAEQERLLAEQEAAEAAAEQARLEAEARARDEKYQAIVDEADRLTEENELVAAVGKFREALDVKPEEQYPIVRIEEIRGMISRQQEAQEAYDAAIARADRDFENESFDDARSGYNDAKQAKPEESYPDEMLARIDSIVSERARLAAEAEAAEQARLAALEAERDRNFNRAVSRGDSLFNLEEYEPSRTAYQSALEVKPDETYPQQRIDEIGNILAQLASAQEAYDTAITRADRDFENESFDDARLGYNEAKQAKPEDIYPDEMLAQIDSIVTERARLAAEAEAEEQARLAALEAERDQNFNRAVSRGDSLFNLEEYEPSRTAYQSALEVKPDETYPQQRIDEIGNILAQLASAQEDYDAAIARADRDFENESFDDARSGYNEAKQAKPEETYPDEMLAQIDSIVSERARLAAEAEAAEQERLAALEAERDRNFNRAVSRGDSLFNLEEYEPSRTAYKSALEVKPDETYPQQRIDEIGNILAQLASAQEAYDAAIAQADRDFESESFDDARSGYNDAKQAKPEETYPDKMLARIDSIVSERARLAAEAEAAEQERLAALEAERDRNYNQSVLRGDSLFNLEEYEPSRTAYQSALEVKPDETYPQQRIDEIENILAQLASAQEAYDAAIARADRDFTNRNFNQAKSSYEEALEIKPEENYPQERIITINNMLQQQELDEMYRKIILAADGFFESESYPDARQEYESALELKPDESYPKSQIVKIDNLLRQEEARIRAEQQAEADMERRREQLAERQSEMEEQEIMSEAGLNQLYDEYIALGDDYFDSERYNVSRAWYYKALNVKPEEPYPSQRIDEINRIISSLLMSQRDRDYQRFINLADSTLRENQLAVARGWYNRALSVKSNESYPLNQLQEIQNRVEERLAGQSGEIFKSHVQKGTEAFENENYNVARFWFKKALELKPDDKQANEKLNEIVEVLK